MNIRQRVLEALAMSRNRAKRKRTGARLAAARAALAGDLEIKDLDVLEDQRLAIVVDHITEHAEAHGAEVARATERWARMRAERAAGC